MVCEGIEEIFSGVVGKVGKVGLGSSGRFRFGNKLDRLGSCGIGREERLGNGGSLILDKFGMEGSSGCGIFGIFCKCWVFVYILMLFMGDIRVMSKIVKII